MDLDDVFLVLRDAVGADTTSPDAIGAAVRAEVVRAEAPMPWELRLQHPGVATAALVLLADGEPSHLELGLAPTAGVSLGTLQALFGEPHPLPLSHWNRPTQVAFYPVTLAGRRFTCAIIASLSPGAEPSSESAVTAVIFRRDPVIR